MDLKKRWKVWLPLVGIGLMPQLAAANFDTDGDYAADDIDTYPCDPSAAATAFSPALGEHGMLLFEDQFPSQGDFDFNDVAVTYNYVFRLDRNGKVASFRVTFNPLAVGGSYHSGLGLRIPFPAHEIKRATRTVAGVATRIDPSPIDADATFFVSDDLRELFARPNELINVDPTLPRQVGEVIELEVEFDQARVFDVSLAPFDIFIFRTQDPSIEVHRPEFRGTTRFDTGLFNTQDDASSGNRNFVDVRGIPFALHFPVIVDYPAETVPIDQLYPEIVPFGQSGGTQFTDFYTSVVNAQFAYRDIASQPAPAPRFVSTRDIPADTSCVPAWGVAVQWGTKRSLFTYGGDIAPNGDAVITGYTAGNFPGASNAGGLDGFVARHDLYTGAELWMTQLGTAGDDTGRDVVVDSQGFIYVAGEQSDQASGSFFRGLLAGVTDAFVAKLAPDGTLLWTTTLGGNGNDAAYGVEVDDQGNVYVAGSASDRMTAALDPGGYPSSFLAKLDPNGQVVWLQQYRTDSAHPSNYSGNIDLALDRAAGALYVVGTERRYNRDPSAATNPVVTKHRISDGAMLWVEHLGDYGYWNGSLDGRFGYGFGVDVDDFDGAVYVTGSFGTGELVDTWGSWSKPVHDDSPDAFFTKLTPGGQVVWSHCLASETHGEEYAEAVHTSGVGGAVYFTGRTTGKLPGMPALGGSDYYLASIGHDGAIRWVEQGGTPYQDMGHLAATVNPSQSGGVLFTIGNTDAAMGAGLASWRTNFYRHDLGDGALLSTTPAVQTDWEAGNWSACSNTCGAGTMTRSLACMTPEGAVAPEEECLRVPPSATGACEDYSGCGASWRLGAWSACSVTCGVGERTRPVQCIASDGAQQPEAACGGVPPARSEACGDYSTCTHDWQVSDWSSCSQPTACALGAQSRTVYCLRSDGTTVKDEDCVASRPYGARACQTLVCPAQNTSCAALLAAGTTTSGRYDIDPDGSGPAPAVNVYCDMDSFGGGWTNLDFATDRVWLDGAHFIECGAGLVQDATSVTCMRPRFDGQESLPLYQFRCDGQDRSVDYVRDHVAPLLGHASQRLVGFTRLNSGQMVGGGGSTAGNEYCYAHGVLARYDHAACAEYRQSGVNQQCVPGFFTLGL